MAFKMKGPGLPGFRKNAGSGFYKGSGFNINTSNRSPIKQGEEENEYKKTEQDAIDKARKEYIKYIEEGGDPNKVKWDDMVVEVKQEVKNRTTTTTTEESQWGVIEGDEVIGPLIKPGDKGYDAWLKADKTRFEDKKVFKGEVNVEEKTKNPDIDWTNAGLRLHRVGHGSGIVSHDQNDGSFRYRVLKNSGEAFGELSASDINNMVKKGELKHEIKGGQATGRLLMSKDYHENTYQPLVEMQQDQQDNADQFDQKASQFRSTVRKNAIQAGLEAGKKGSKAYKQASSDYRKKAKSENPKMYPKRGNPEWMHNNPNYPASYNQPKVGIYNDDEMVNNWTNYEKNDEGQWVSKENATGMGYQEYNKLSEEEQNEINKNLNQNKGRSKTGAKGRLEKEDTPSFLSNFPTDESDFATGSEEEMRINE